MQSIFVSTTNNGALKSMQQWQAELALLNGEFYGESCTLLIGVHQIVLLNLQELMYASTGGFGIAVHTG